jgi:hypothetical protein
MDSNSRSRMWPDKLTNIRGRELEEFLINQQLFIINKESDTKTFQSSRGPSNIDLTISNYKLLKKVQEWKISEEESCSDHKIIQFCIGQYNTKQTGNNFQSIKYIAKEENLKKFEASVTQESAEQMCGSSWKEETIAVDKYITSRIATTVDMEDTVNRFSDALTACNKTFKIVKPFTKTNKHKTVPGG